MTADLVLGVDLGTYEAKGVAVAPDGSIVASATRPHRMGVPRPGWAEHDPEGVWWDGFIAVVSQILAHEQVTAERIAAVGCSGIGPCVLPVDADGRPLRDAILYGVDTRSTAQIAALEETFGVETIFARTGNRLTTQSAGPKITWIRDEEPEVFAAARRFVTSQTFLVGRLTDRWVIDHGTAGYYDPLYDPERLRWAPDWSGGVVDENRLPELGWSDEIAGAVTPGAAELTGLRAGTPVVVGATDAPAEAVGSGVTVPGRVMVMYGSTVFIIGVLDRPVPDPRMWSAPFVFPGTYVLAGGTATAGTLTRWFVDLVAPGVSVEDLAALFKSLAEEAATTPPGAEGLLLLPYFSGERTPLNDPKARGTIFGLTLTHGRGHLYRALLEGIAQGVRANLEVYRECGIDFEVIRAVGGGTKNELWLQAVSDVTGSEQTVVTGPGAAYGDAFLAALAVGTVDGPEAIDGWLEPSAVVRPEPSRSDLYERQAQRIAALYQATRSLMHEIAEEQG